MIASDKIPSSGERKGSNEAGRCSNADARPTIPRGGKMFFLLHEHWFCKWQNLITAVLAEAICKPLVAVLIREDQEESGNHHDQSSYTCMQQEKEKKKR